MQLFYNPNITQKTQQITFDKEESIHIIKVLRKKEGDTLHITNGKGWLFKAIITVAHIKNCVATIKEQKEKLSKKYYLHMAVAPTKSNDRYEWFLEKAVEIGIHEITPIICEHSERRKINPSRFEKIIQSAMKQSQQCFLPKLNPAVSLKEFLKTSHEGQKFIAHCGEGEKYTLKRNLMPDHRVTILIGPEGDFSEAELQLAKKDGFLPLTLSENRLRTETAAVVACHGVVFVNSF
ncbi:16S rRNA (uracil(1498)-N(3))-methyltransferase [Leptobacterium sp. I13]|uniref:16S rRNA (uracil(1498)-N(3))-methyltransferase n=1 Tax=Leptobacterium meishanense TaxID=3128904 RepID=UPI0030EF2DB0